MKTKTRLSIAALMALIIMIIAACSSSTAVDSYETFSRLMDKLVGPGQWSAKNHTSGPDNLLTVTKLTFNLKPSVTPAPAQPPAQPVDPKAPKTPDQTPDVPAGAVNPMVVEIATVEIKAFSDPKTMETVLSAVDWRDQKEVKLADSVTLKDVSLRTSANTGNFQLTMETVDANGIKLAAAGTDAPAGRIGFFKALSLDRLSYQKPSTKIRTKDLEVVSTSTLTEMRDVAFSGKLISELEVLDPSGLYTLMSLMTAGSISSKDISMDFKGLSPDIPTGRLVVASIDGKNTGSSAVGEANLNGFRLDLVDRNDNVSLTMGLNRLHIQGLDLSAYIQKMMPLLAAANLNSKRVQDIAGVTYTLADFFVSPFSLDKVSFSDFEISLKNLISIKVAEAETSGPFQAGMIPRTQKSTLTGMVVTLPQNAKDAEKAGLKELYDFGQQFGMTQFVIDAEGEGTYDPETGRMVTRTTRFAVKDLVELSGSFELDGLTAKRLAQFKKVPMSMIAMSLASDDIFGDVGIHGITFKMEDKGLMNRHFAYTARMASERQGAAVAPEDIRALVVSSIQTVIKQKGAQFLANPAVLSAALVEFIENPASLEFKIAADPAFGPRSVMTAGDNLNSVLNSLNLSVSSNGKTSPPLKFALPAKQ